MRTAAIGPLRVDAQSALALSFSFSTSDVSDVADWLVQKPKVGNSVLTQVSFGDRTHDTRLAAISQVANTWPKKTGRDKYSMVRNRKECQNPKFSSVAATFEKANT